MYEWGGIHKAVVFEKQDIFKLLEEIKNGLSQIYGDRLHGLYLYGSYATQEACPESDVDIAVILLDLQDYWEEVQRTSQIISELSLKYDVNISPVRLRESEWRYEESPFLSNLRKEAIPI